MDSPATATRGKGRTSARKRHTLPAAPSSQNSTAPTDHELADHHPSSTPGDNIPPSPFSFEVPSPTTTRSTYARARAAEGPLPSSDDPDSKGGRSLRKRARVDYTFDQADGYMSDGDKTTSSSARAPKRRRTDSALHENEDAEDYIGPYIKRRSSEQLPLSSASRRRSQVQKSTSNSHLASITHTIEDVDVKDTIEVGGQCQNEPSDGPAHKRTCSDVNISAWNHAPKRRRLSTPTYPMPNPQKYHSDFTSLVSSNNHRENVVGQPEEVQSPRSSVSESPTNSNLFAPYEHLTPYIKTVYVKWPFAQQEAEAEPGPDSQAPQQDVADEIADDLLDGAPQGGTEVENALEDALIPDTRAQTDSTPVDDILEEESLPVDTVANTPAADAEPSYINPDSTKPILFKKPRDASDFTSLFEDYKSLTPEELWVRLEVTNRALVAWQNEYNELRKITDDERNAARYRQHNASYEHRVKMHASRNPGGAPPEQAKFIVRGIRAPRPDAEVVYARDQDRLMAAVYGFEYDENVNKIGFQDPLAQRPGGKGRLRERPKQTAKAAEADDAVVLHGKRTRKPPALFDGSEAASARSTPAPVQRRRRKAANATEDITSEAKPPGQEPIDTPAEVAPPKKKGKGGRPRKHPLPAPIPECPIPAEDAQEGPEQAAEQELKATRKGRRTKATTQAPIVEEETPATNGADKQAPGNTRLRRTDSRLSEVPSSSFYTPSSSMQSATAVEESRPPTSSSTATQSTVASNYQLREKRQKVFTLNPNEEGFDEVPKPKRARRTKKTQAEDDAVMAPLPPPTPTSLSAQKPALEPVSASKPPPKIKLKNYSGHVTTPTSAPHPNPFSVPSSTNSTPSQSSNGTSNGTNNGTSNGVANGTDPVDTKDYKQMTKSEKMSQSMKARWASGSMSQAVAKRRATLANKKQAVKAAEPAQPVELPPVATKS